MEDERLRELLHAVRETADLAAKLSNEVLAVVPLAPGQDPPGLDPAKLDEYATALTDHRAAVGELRDFLRSA